MDAHLRLYRDAPGATDLVDRLEPDFVWLPADLAVIQTLESEGWHPVFRGPASVVLSRRADVSEVSGISEGGPRCFPSE